MNFKPFLILALLVYSVTGLTEITCSNKECICSNQSLKCNFNNSTHQVIFIESTNVTSLELTMNSLDTIVLPKKSTNLKELILRCNRFKSIPVDQFINVPQLATLDLSMNRIESLSEITFQSVHQLRKINLSESLAPGFKLDRQLCELVSLEVIDLSYLDIGNFTLGCWKSIKRKKIKHIFTTHLNVKIQLNFEPKKRLLHNLILYSPKKLIPSFQTKFFVNLS